MNWLNTHW